MKFWDYAASIVKHVYVEKDQWGNNTYGENRSSRSNTWPSPILSSTNPTQTAVGSKFLYK